MAATRRLGGPGYPLVERVKRSVERHRMVKRGDTVLVAVSGGPDSTCLLDVMARLGDTFDLSLAVGHVDHGLGADSAEVASRVASESAEAGFEAHVVRAPDLAGPNLQERARNFRLGFLSTVAERIGAARVATGHTLDDRVETTLARLIHGAGTDGLAGLRPADGPRIRPLIEVRRAETRTYCEELGLAFYDDPANHELRFERVGVREEVLRAITERWGVGAMDAIARSCERLSEDSDALGGIADRLYPSIATSVESGVQLATPDLVKLPRGLRRRLLEQAVGRVRDRSGGIEAVLDRLEDDTVAPASFAVAEGMKVGVSSDTVVVDRGHAAAAESVDRP
ncbi:MAG: tRNA lysidine(34) synthetase TilS [Actinobacteria bacterium]|nr:tRNA lysidine(34) synthetase TilS [Actinomycetota bacterium]MDQ3532401.1 tRNA lysidine(34) synthetase TilS [Actinomycetota bacterium]